MSRLLKQMSLIVSTELQQIAIDLVERMDEDKLVKYIRLKDEFRQVQPQLSNYNQNYHYNQHHQLDINNNNNNNTNLNSNSTHISSLVQKHIQQLSSNISNNNNCINQFDIYNQILFQQQCINNNNNNNKNESSSSSNNKNEDESDSEFDNQSKISSSHSSSNTTSSQERYLSNKMQNTFIDRFVD
jgi:hypothetical protein